MVEYIAMRTENGHSVAFEVDNFDGPVPAGHRWDATADRINSTLEDGVENIRDVMRTVAEKIADMAQRPDKVTVELGIKVAAQAGVVIAKSTAEAHIKVSLEWGQSANPTAQADDDTTAVDQSTP